MSVDQLYEALRDARLGDATAARIVERLMAVHGASLRINAGASGAPGTARAAPGSAQLPPSMAADVASLPADWDSWLALLASVQRSELAG